MQFTFETNYNQKTLSVMAKCIRKNPPLQKQRGVKHNSQAAYRSLAVYCCNM